MKEVAAYYDSHGNTNEQMEAHYLLGCAYRDMGESTMEIGGVSFTYRMDATTQSLILDSGSAVDGPVYKFHKMK